jgi:fatty acid desaturase
LTQATTEPPDTSDHRVLPTMVDIRAAIPSQCFERKLSTSLRHAATSVALTATSAVLAWLFVPFTWAWLPVWIAYAAVTGTFATGVWVIAHECGHGAFCENKRVQDTIGFVLHSALLVPYFSWQRSHAIHHAKTNHLQEGETHVPKRVDSDGGMRLLATRDVLGSRAHAVATLFVRLVFGWPIYLLTGATGGSTRGTTNHFWPWAPFSQSLFPARWARKVILSTAGVLLTLGLLGWWVAAQGVVVVLALFVAPYLVCNAWVVAYTWLHHSDEYIPHYQDAEWSFVKGAFCSVDRPYGPVLDFLHHGIGSTHAAHHLFTKIPHYHAATATRALAKAFPELYQYDPTPVPTALWRTTQSCVAVARSTDGWRYVDKDPGATG